MVKFKDIDEYFLHLEKIQHKALTGLNVINNKNIKDLSEREIHDNICLKMNANPAILKKVKDEMTEKLFEHLNDFDLTNKIDILDLKMIIDAIEEVKYYKKLNMNSVDSGAFLDEIKQLENVANRMSLMSINKDNTIKLPQFDHFIRYSLWEYFDVRNVLAVESIRIIMQLVTKRKPRVDSKKVNKESDKYGRLKPKTNIDFTDKIYDSYSRLGENLMAKLREGATLTSINNSIDSDPVYKNEIKETEYYSAND